MEIRCFRPGDAQEMSQLLCRNFAEVNSRDYSKEEIDALIQSHGADFVLGLSEYANIYVFTENNEIVACGAISSFWGSLTESILLTIFVMPELHGRGLGREIVRTLEQDELFLRARRVEIPASITACGFYEKLGYTYKNGVKQLDDEKLYRMEKFR